MALSQIAQVIDLGIVKGEPADAEEVLALIEEQHLIDTEPVAESTKLIQSGGVYTAIEDAKSNVTAIATRRYVATESVPTYDDLPAEPSSGAIYCIEESGSHVQWDGESWVYLNNEQVIHNRVVADEMPLTGAAIVNYVDNAIAATTTEEQASILAVSVNVTDGYKVLNATECIGKKIIATRDSTACNGLQLVMDSEAFEGTSFELFYRVPVGSEGLSTTLYITSSGVTARTYPIGSTKGVYTGLAFRVGAIFLGGEWQLHIEVLSNATGVISTDVTTYKITFSGANREATKSLTYTQTVEVGANATLRNDILTSYYGGNVTRIGWNTAADGSGIGYTNDATIANIGSNLTLYPVWQGGSITGTWQTQTWTSILGGGNSFVYVNDAPAVVKSFNAAYYESYIDVKLTMEVVANNQGEGGVILVCNGQEVATLYANIAKQTFTATSGWVRLPLSSKVDSRGYYNLTLRPKVLMATNKGFTHIKCWVSAFRYH